MTEDGKSINNRVLNCQIAAMESCDPMIGHAFRDKDLERINRLVALQASFQSIILRYFYPLCIIPRLDNDTPTKGDDHAKASGL